MRSGFCRMTRLCGADLPLAEAVYNTLALLQAPDTDVKKASTSNSVYKGSFQRYKSYRQSILLIPTNK